MKGTGKGRCSGKWPFTAEGFALVIAAAFERRRHDIDPVILARRKTVRAQRDKIAHAARLPQKEAAAEIAEALRCLVAERPDVRSGRSPGRHRRLRIDRLRAGPVWHRHPVPLLDRTSQDPRQPVHRMIRFACSLACFLLAPLGVSVSAAEPEQLLSEAVQEYRRRPRLARPRCAAGTLSPRRDALRPSGRGRSRQPQRRHPQRRPLREPGQCGHEGQSISGRPSWPIAGPCSLILTTTGRGRTWPTPARSCPTGFLTRRKADCLDTFFAWTGRLSPAELQTLAGLAFLVTAALVAVSIRWRQPLLRNLAILPGLAWLVLLAALVFLIVEARHNDAVVTLPEVVARSADSAGASPRFPQPLPGGTEVQVLETRDQWSPRPPLRRPRRLAAADCSSNGRKIKRGQSHILTRLGDVGKLQALPLYLRHACFGRRPVLTVACGIAPGTLPQGHPFGRRPCSPP